MGGVPPVAVQLPVYETFSVAGVGAVHDSANVVGETVKVVDWVAV